MTKENLTNLIRNIPDFPQPGIQFKDITPILQSPEAFRYIVDTFASFAKANGVTAIAAPEARGFLFGSALAYAMNLPFIPIRKKGKLPFSTIEVSYELEYGQNILAIHTDALKPQDKVIIVDDLIATSGTIHACKDLIEKSGAEVSCIATLIVLSSFQDQHGFDNLPFLKLLEF